MNLFQRKHIKKKGLDVNDVIGQVVLCEDDVLRVVIEITEPVNPMMAKSGLFIINEHDPDSDSGHYVHALTISNKLLGLNPPSRESREAASRLWRQMALANADDILKKQRAGKLNFDFND